MMDNQSCANCRCLCNTKLKDKCKANNYDYFLPNYQTLEAQLKAEETVHNLLEVFNQVQIDELESELQQMKEINLRLQEAIEKAAQDIQREKEQKQIYLDFIGIVTEMWDCGWDTEYVTDYIERHNAKYDGDDNMQVQIQEKDGEKVLSDKETLFVIRCMADEFLDKARSIQKGQDNRHD